MKGWDMEWRMRTIFALARTRRPSNGPPKQRCKVWVWVCLTWTFWISYFLGLLTLPLPCTPVKVWSIFDFSTLLPMPLLALFGWLFQKKAVQHASCRFMPFWWPQASGCMGWVHPVSAPDMIISLSCGTSFGRGLLKIFADLTAQKCLCKIQRVSNQELWFSNMLLIEFLRRKLDFSYAGIAQNPLIFKNLLG